MKLICSKTDLLNGVNIVLKAVPAKSTLDILECIVIRAYDEKIKLIGNDMALGIETIVAGEIVDEGTVAINAKIFSDIVRKLPDNEIAIIAEDNNVKIKCEKVNFNIMGRDAADFPALPQIEKNNSARISQLILRDIIRQTVFSIGSENESSKIMSGELLEINGKRLRLVALDGHRIAVRNVELKDDYGNQSVIVPGKTLTEIMKILSGELEDEVNIYFSSNNIMFEMKDTIVLSRLIEGKYYMVDQMLSGDYETRVNVNNREFVGCIDRAMLLLKESDKKPLVIGIKNEEMEVKMNTQMGRFDEKLSIDRTGDDILIAFNPKFMLDALRAIDDEDIDMYMMNVKSPCIIKDKDETYMYLILPVNFNPAE